LQLTNPHRREITATERRLIATGIAIIRLVRTLIATGGQENGRFYRGHESSIQTG
jgi:hypothetical protein